MMKGWSPERVILVSVPLKSKIKQDKSKDIVILNTT